MTLQISTEQVFAYVEAASKRSGYSGAEKYAFQVGWLASMLANVLSGTDAAAERARDEIIAASGEGDAQ